jgi:hypothetical protein
MRQSKANKLNTSFISTINSIRWGIAISNKLLENPSLKKGGELEKLFTELNKRMNEGNKAMEEMAKELDIDDY